MDDFNMSDHSKVVRRHDFYRNFSIKVAVAKVCRTFCCVSQGNLYSLYNLYRDFPV